TPFLARDPDCTWTYPLHIQFNLRTPEPTPTTTIRCRRRTYHGRTCTSATAKPAAPGGLTRHPPGPPSSQVETTQAYRPGGMVSVTTKTAWSSATIRAGHCAAGSRA